MNLHKTLATEQRATQLRGLEGLQTMTAYPALNGRPAGMLEDTRTDEITRTIDGALGPDQPKPQTTAETHLPNPTRTAPVPFPQGSIDLDKREIHYEDGQHCALSNREVALLRYFVNNPRRVISRQELLVQVWQLNPQFILTRTIDMHLAKLRRKLRDDAEEPTVLHTIRGEGYRWWPKPQG